MPQTNNKTTKWYKKWWIWTIFLIVITASFTIIKKGLEITNNAIVMSSNTTIRTSFGSETCITNIRPRFNTFNTMILREEYLENGSFGITLFEKIRGEIFYTLVSTDNNCNIVYITNPFR
jgi:hypothetical protein